MGGPYPPTTAVIGGIPTASTDIPICAVLMAIYIIGLIIHVRIFRHNRSIKRPFRLSVLLIYICFFRTVTLSLRIAWTKHLTNIGLVIAAQVFVTAGVLLLFILNLIFVQRLLRASHPSTGWHAVTGRMFVAYYVLVVLTLFSVVICFVQSLYTLDPHIRQVDHSMTLYGGTFFLFAAFFPVPFAGINYLTLVRKRNDEVDGIQNQDGEKLGTPQRPRMAGSITHGSTVLIVGALLLTLGAGFRTGVAYAPPRQANDPAWYDSKASFYVFNFVTELGVIYLYALTRVDRIFYVPAIEKVSEQTEDAVQTLKE